MKKIIIMCGVVLSSIGLNTSYAQGIEEPDSTGLPGDGLDLTAVLNAFKEAESIEAFEEALNKEDNGYNNLDLNQDGDVDYIRVEDHVEGDAHAIILQVPVSETESQDVAAIELEKTGEEEVQVQIVGDEDIYGEDYLVEPADDKTDKSPAAIGARIIINVWAWPSVRFVYGPNYRVWVSPWRWASYPRWWKPWRPVRWGVYRHRHVRHHRNFRVVHVHRCHGAHRVYHTHRKSSATVKKRHAVAHKKHKATHKSKAKVGRKQATKKKAKAATKKPANKPKARAKTKTKAKAKSGGRKR